MVNIGPVGLGATTNLLEVTTIPPSGFLGGEVIVSEFLRDPSTISDGDGEWVEVYNTTESDIDIEGWFLADDDFDFHQIDAGGAGVIVPAAGFALLGANADELVNGGITLDYEWSDFFLSNSTSSAGDEIRLIDFSGVEVDRLKYTVPDGWPLQGGQSTSLDPGKLDGTLNDDPESWCLETEIYDTVAFVNAGTPGTDNNDCGAPPVGEQGDVIITEIMQNPSALPDGEGEYIELFNTTGGDIDIEGWTISDLGADSHVIDAGGAGVIVPAGGYATLATSATPGFTPTYVYSSFFLANGDDEVILTDSGGQKQDEVLYDGGPLFPDPTGASMNFAAGVSQDALTNNDGANWCEALSSFASGDLGTPGAPNDDCFKQP